MKNSLLPNWFVVGLLWVVLDDDNYSYHDGHQKLLVGVGASSTTQWPRLTSASSDASRLGKTMMTAAFVSSSRTTRSRRRYLESNRESLPSAWVIGQTLCMVSNKDNNEDDLVPEQDKQEEGAELAQQFYTFQKTQQDRDTPSPSSAPVKKFTGASPQPRLSFSSSSSSLFDDADNNSPLSREREREFNLVGTFERTLPIQAGIVALSLAFVLYVGLTGGIPSGSMEDGLMDEYNYYDAYEYNYQDRLSEAAPAAREEVDENYRQKPGVWL